MKTIDMNEALKLCRQGELLYCTPQTFTVIGVAAFSFIGMG